LTAPDAQRSAPRSKAQSPLRKIAGAQTQSQLLSTETEERANMAETTVKHKVLKAIEELPHDATFEDVLERLYFLYKIDKGLQQVAAGETISHEEAMKRIKTWHV
jgi:predicted transcriptional regulator